MPNILKKFLKLESASGIVLMLAAILAIVVNNSPLHHAYQSIVHFHFDLNLFGSIRQFSLEHFVNDFLMVFFFLIVGLEIRREISTGELATRAQAILPIMAAAGGMLLPILFFMIFNHSDPVNRAGWAIPAATDIAFAIGVLNMFGRRVPLGLKIFLTALAIIDDLGAILIIAFFFSAGISGPWLGMAVGSGVALATISKYLSRMWPLMLLFSFLIWLGVLFSGVHATIAGVVIAMLLPGHLGKKIEHALLTPISFWILPTFAFLNSGVTLSVSSLQAVLTPLPLGIVAGLFFGKQLGIFISVYLMVRLKWAAIPGNASWRQVLGVAALGGIGFTMSLFIGGLAFNDDSLSELVRLGVIVGSLMSGIWGAFLLLSADTSRRVKNS
jgi:NhaA family Na+:H+ antiporter